MAIENYSAAKKIGQKAARSAVSNGAYPYLRALDEFVSREDICGEQPLGIVDIPLDKIGWSLLTVILSGQIIGLVQKIGAKKDASRKQK